MASLFAHVPLGGRQFAGLALLLVLTIWPHHASAQVAVVVNGAPITVYDIEQRSRLILLSTRKASTRQATIEELIGDKLKLQTAKRYGIEVSDTDVDNAFATIARNARGTPESFTKTLQASGLNPATFKSKLRADLAWGQIIRGKFRSSLEIGEKDILNLMETKKTDTETGFEYILRPILFVIPSGSPESVVNARRREAEALRGRFQNCEEGIRFARALRDVAVREPVRRTSGDLSPQLRAVLDKVAVGQLTTPEVTQGGIEVFALCEKKENKIETAGKREARDEIFSKRFQQQADHYLKELRRGAMIETK